MAKKKNNDYQRQVKYGKIIFRIFAFSVLIDFAVLFLAFGKLSGDTFWLCYGLYAWAISPVTGILTTIIACAITKKDYDLRYILSYFIIGRVVLVLVGNLIGTLINEYWSMTEDGREVLATFIVVLLLGGIGFFVQWIICNTISDNFLAPKAKPTTYKNNSSNYVPYPSDRVKETDFYKQKAQEYYDLYMGNPPSEKPKPDYSDLDDHDYSHIFKDKNF